MGCSKSASKGKVYSNTGVPQEAKRNLKQPNFTPKEPEKKNKTKLNHSKRKEIIKIKQEIKI